jgi:segregation and condensation protein B
VNLNATIEGLLFVAGDEGLSLDQLDELLPENPATISHALTRLKQDLQADHQRGLVLLQFGEHFKLATKKELAPVIKQYFSAPLSTNLGQATLETLAIIAYQQPVTRVDIDEIRGVQSSGAIQKLVLRQLVEAKGRKEAPGRPILYGTSDFFLDYFELKDLTQLPPLPEPEELAAPETNDLFATFQAQLNQDETKKDED